jgi:hypothetical protein
MRVIPIARTIAHRHLPRAPRSTLPLALVIAGAPVLARAQATSPFMTGASALQTNILAWLTPIAIILVMALGAMAMANRLHSAVAERLRAQYRQRVQQRHERSSVRSVAAVPAPETPRRDLEQVRREARQAWLALRRQSSSERAATQQERGAEAAPKAEDDLAL